MGVLTPFFPCPSKPLQEPCGSAPLLHYAYLKANKHDKRCRDWVAQSGCAVQKLGAVLESLSIADGPFTLYLGFFIAAEEAVDFLLLQKAKARLSQ